MSSNHRELILLSVLAFFFHLSGRTDNGAHARPAPAARVQVAGSSVAQVPYRPAQPLKAVRLQPNTGAPAFPYSMRPLADTLEVSEGNRLRNPVQ
jgi:hypothetical protein